MMVCLNCHQLSLAALLHPSYSLISSQRNHILFFTPLKPQEQNVFFLYISNIYIYIYI